MHMSGAHPHTMHGELEPKQRTLARPLPGVSKRESINTWPSRTDLGFLFGPATDSRKRKAQMLSIAGKNWLPFT